MMDQMDATAEEEDNSKEPYMRRLSRFNDLCPTKAILVVVLRHRSSVFQRGNDVRPFFLCQEAGLFWRVRKEEKGDDAKDKGKYAFLSRLMSITSQTSRCHSVLV